MQWQGKVLGALVGLIFGPMGALVGLVLGHVYDSQPTPAGARPAPGSGGSALEIRKVFYETTFAVMGHLAKLDGRVSESEIQAARQVMQFLQLGPDQVQNAIACFSRGKAPEYPLSVEISRLRQLCAGHPQLLRLFMDLQVRAAIAGNDLVGPVRARLQLVAEALGFSAIELAHIEMMDRVRRGGVNSRPAGSALADSYAVLGINDQASDAEVKKAYRRQMSENHPDKLVARGLPESMQELAKEKTQRVREAYETIAASRGFR